MHITFYKLEEAKDPTHKKAKEERWQNQMTEGTSRSRERRQVLCEARTLNGQVSQKNPVT